MYKSIKKIVDTTVAFLGIFVLSPILICLTLLLLFTNRGSPFFVQRRAGYKGAHFLFLKFKTMVDSFDEKGKLLPDHKRITKVGKFIRSTSLDELPQLLNVLIGQMSLIGPRPLPIKYLDRYTHEQLRRHDIRPGITGWAQVNGRNSISWEKKFELDVFYVENVNFWLDLKILWLTVVKVFRRDGINSEKEVTMGEFKGSN